MKKNPYEEVLKDRKHTIKLLDYVYSLKMDLKDFPVKLERLLSDKFIVTDEKGEDQTDLLVQTIVDWENDQSISTSLESLIHSEFYITEKP